MREKRECFSKRGREGRFMETMLDLEKIEDWGSGLAQIHSKHKHNTQTENRQNVAKQNQTYGNKQRQNPYITVFAYSALNIQFLSTSSFITKFHRFYDNLIISQSQTRNHCKTAKSYIILCWNISAWIQWNESCDGKITSIMKCCNIYWTFYIACHFLVQCRFCSC